VHDGRQRWPAALKWPPFAVRPISRIDIDGIWDYIAEDSQAQADAFVDRIIMKFKLLALEPGLGRLRDDLMPELQSFPFERYVIFYRCVAGGIEVVRVLHSAEAQFRPRS
jgi:toxin ParE1/3/4